MNAKDATLTGEPRQASKGPQQPLPQPPSSLAPAPPPRDPTAEVSPPSWDVGNVAHQSPSETVSPFTALVSFHFLRAAVRRQLALCLVSAMIGVLLGGAFLLVAPGRHTATSTLVLAHDSQVDPSRAMATDVGLLNTRIVAETAIRKLGIQLDPQDLLESVTALPPTSDVLELTLTAPSDTEAVSRLDAFTTAYLEFRADQVSVQSDALLKGYTDRMSVLQTQIDELNTRITTLSGQGSVAQDRLGDSITQRSQLQNQISSLQESAQDVSLRRRALVAGSEVVDSAMVKRVNSFRQFVITVVSGLIGGVALCVGGVVLHSILSDRLRLRFEVASALEAPVTLSVGRLRPLPRTMRLLGFLPRVRKTSARRVADLQRMGHAIEKALPEPGHQQRLAVACVENSDEVRMGVAAAAMALQREGRPVDLVDLSEGGGLGPALAMLAHGKDVERPRVHRPAVIPSLTTGPADLDAASGGEALPVGDTGICIVLADLDPRIGADHLKAWTNRVVVAVTAGKSSVDRIRTTGDLIRAADIHLIGAVLIRTLADDASPGMRAPQAQSPTTPAIELVRDAGSGTAVAESRTS